VTFIRSRFAAFGLLAVVLVLGRPGCRHFVLHPPQPILRGPSSTIALLLTAALMLGGIAALILVLVRRQTLHSASQTKGLQGSAHHLMLIANEILALDHVYVAKGLTVGAVARIKESRSRLGLDADPDLSQITDRLEPYYSHFIWRLISEPKKVNLYRWLVEAIRLLERLNEVNLVIWTKEEFEQQMRNPNLTGHWLVRIQNWDCPDIYDRFQLYYDPRSAGYFEHWLSDNFRHARSWSAVVLEYAVNTTWNRKMTVRFFNDGAGVVDPARPRSNLAAQLGEVTHEYHDFLELARKPTELGKHEKFWLRIWDFISILEDIYARQTGDPASGPLRSRS